MSTKSNKKEKNSFLGNKKNRPKSDKEDLEEENRVHCICRKKSFGNMIECDECKEWFHYECVGIDEDDVPEEWKCEECEKKLKKDKSKISSNKKNKSKSNKNDLEEEKKVYCICRKNSFGNMIECDECKEWFHYDCVGIDEDNVPEEWNCEECEKKLKKKKKTTKSH